jgi:alpha-L-rhamnosidase
MMKRLWMLLVLAWSATAACAADTVRFQSARPVWPEGRETERNLLVGFRAVVNTPAAEPAVLRLAACTVYRVFLNGAFVGHGPAVAGHGFYRVDEWPLALKAGVNVVAIEVAGYNANSFYLLDQPSFLQAEVVAGEKALAATGGSGFEAGLIPERVQKTQRYSFQRPFAEIWRLAPGFDNWRSDPAVALRKTTCAVVGEKALLPRRVPYPTFALRQPVAHVAAGTVAKGEMPKKPWKDRSLVNIGPKLGGYPEKELEQVPTLELQAVKNVASGPAKSEMLLKQNDFHTVDFGVNLSGFLGATVNVRAKTRLFLTFDEILTNNDVDFKRLGCSNIVLYELEPGSYRVESFEPYTLRYLKLIVLEGECEVSQLHLREYVNPNAGRARFATSDPRFNRIFEAARQTFQQNAVDVFMDCPSRERAGWLCDSFFTARVALDLCGETTVEKNFYENFLLPAKFPHLPEGMLPMCYPSDHNDGVFIPNWALWFVVQLEEYAARSGDRELVNALRPRVLKLLEFFKQYENSDGLLEKLPSWVFVEWSKANSFVQDVNYPSNMLYVRALEVVARLYALPELAQKAERLRATILKQSFDGEFFVDNAKRVEGKLQVTRNRTEVCQYFAFFFGFATPQSHTQLWDVLMKDFGPQRKQTKKFPDVHPANAFIGNQLRFELLSRAGLAPQILDEALGYWLFMADRTGTLWEHDSPQASCNHGFASHAAHVFLRDVLGLYQVDTVSKKIQLRLGDLPLDWCEGAIPTPTGDIQLRWWKEGADLCYQLFTPETYQISLVNLSGRKLQQK